MDFTHAKNYLAQSVQFGIILGLDRIARLMALLGNPGSGCRYIHVAGTNGKGSVTAMTANCLAAEGFKVGIYTSPFIERFSERIRVLDGMDGLVHFSADEAYGEITDDEFALYMTRIRDCVERMLLEGMEQPTEFELITAMAFMHFEKKRCDFVVLEVGLGGRLDSTNVIENPLKCVITAIGYDHMERLGNTIEEITFEKAGIIKQGADVILYNPADYASAQDAAAILSVVRKQCEIKKAGGLTIIGSDKIHMKSYSIEGQVFDYDFGEKNEKLEVATPLLGVYQPMNCAMAIETCRGLVSPDSLKAGIRLTKWPARMEVVRKQSPLSFIDGGHNMQGAAALRDNLERLLEGRKLVFLCGVMKDKEYKKMFETLLSSDHYKVEAIVCTRPDNPRALPASDLAKAVSEILDNLPKSSYNNMAEVISDEKVASATLKAINEAIGREAVFIAFGSLYMAGEIRRLIRNDKGNDIDNQHFK
ncbi:MAG: bifunctional folylpolyglutamate synthase/dihydrofolate synthase [Saccharofermentanales bacterium]